MTEKKQRTCPEGHVLEDTWEQCPFCTADRVESDAAAKAGKRKPVPERFLAGWVVIRSGEQKGEDFRLLTGRNTFGKGASADIVVKDPYLSEAHAEIRADHEGRYTFRDLDSKHGSFVNGESVSDEREISDGDLLQMGRTELRFRSYVD